MMDWTADHVGFVVAAYLVVALLLLGVLLRGLWRARILKRTLASMKLADPGETEQ
jgi:phosphatidylglycerophosphatase A